MIRGGLFTRFFLEDGIRNSQAYDALRGADVEAFAAAARTHWASLAQTVGWVKPIALRRSGDGGA